MELDKLKREALDEYHEQEKSIKAAQNRLIGAQSYWLKEIAVMLFILAIVPPFLALAVLLSHDAVYLLPDNIKIIAERPVTLLYGNQTLQQAADYASRAEITHALTIASIVSVAIMIIALALIFIDAAIISNKCKKFVEQYIYEHSKSK